MAFTSEQKIAFRKKLKARGICGVCYKAKVKKNCVSCPECCKRAVRLGAARYENFKKEGRCVRCRGILNPGDPLTCVSCKDYIVRNNLERRSL